MQRWFARLPTWTRWCAFAIGSLLTAFGLQRILQAITSWGTAAQNTLLPAGTASFALGGALMVAGVWLLKIGFVARGRAV